ARAALPGRRSPRPSGRSRRRGRRALGGEFESVSLGQTLDVALVEELDPDAGVPLLELAHLPVLLRYERLLHHGDLDVEILVGEVEVGREPLEAAALGVLLEHEPPRL